MAPILLLLLLLLSSSSSSAHDGFENIHSPKGGNCCGDRDCGLTRTRIVNGQLQAFVDKPEWPSQWVDVPDDAVLPAELNPYAGPAVCWLPGRGVICFFPGRGM